jgi:hypothetical protein
MYGVYVPPRKPGGETGSARTAPEVQRGFDDYVNV